MNRKMSVVYGAAILFFCLIGIANASLTTIGYATYNSEEYKLIWDDDNNGNSVVWLDYTNSSAKYDSQKNWVGGLDAQLSYRFIDGYSVSWESDWRLPSGVKGEPTLSYDGSTKLGYNVTDSEMGHLFYIELGNTGKYNSVGEAQAVFGLTNTGEFENLRAANFWSGFKYLSNVPYTFSMATGMQSTAFTQYDSRAGLVIRTAQVTQAPVPSTFILLLSGTIGLAGVSRRKK